MSDLLNSLHNPAPTKSWAQEVSEAGASQASSPAPEAVAPSPAPEPAPAAEAAPEPSQPAPEATEQEDRRVPLKALQEERQKRAEYERQVQDYQRQLQEYQAWAADMQRQQMGQNGNAAANAGQTEPDPETDPIGALKHAREQLRQIQQMTQQQAYVQQLKQAAYSAASQYSQQVPDYQDAYRYAINSRMQELVALGTPSDAVQQILQQEELNLAETAIQNRRNPAEAIYEFAKARGYQSKQGASAVPAGLAPAAAPNPALQQQKAAVAASASAGGAPAAKGEMSAAQIADLKGAAFDQAWTKLFGGNKSSMFRE